MADSEIVGIVEDATPDATDVVYAQDTAGTVDKKVQFANFPVSTPVTTAVAAAIAQHVIDEPHGGGGGAGDVSTTDTSTAGWAFVLDEDDMVSNSATKLPTQQSVKAYVDGKGTLTSTDLGIVNVYTLDGVTYLDVDSLLTSAAADFPDDDFYIHDPATPANRIRFELGGLTGPQVLTVPNVTGTLVTTDAGQTLTNKVVRGPHIDGAGADMPRVGGETGNGYGQLITGTGWLDSEITVADLGAIPGTQIHGLQTVYTPALTFMHSAGTYAALGATALNNTIGKIAARGVTSALDRSSGDRGVITFFATEAYTATAQGTAINLRTTPTGGTTLTTGLRVDAATPDPGIVVRGAVSVNAGSGMASAAAGVAVDVASGTVLSRSGGVGYGTGAGGTVTQATSKATGVTLSKTCGQITMNGAALAASTTVSFTLTNTNIAAGDILVLNHVSAGTAGAYTLNAQCAAGTASINVRNVTLGSLSEAIVIGFALVKAVTA